MSTEAIAIAGLALPLLGFLGTSLFRLGAAVRDLSHSVARQNEDRAVLTNTRERVLVLEPRVDALSARVNAPSNVQAIRPKAPSRP